MTGGSSTAYNTTSDMRTKENIIPAQRGLHDLLRLPVHEYSYKNDQSQTRMTGFLAQELYRIYPEAVTTNGDDGVAPLGTRVPWSVDYGRLTPLLANSIKDFATIVDVSSAPVGRAALTVNSIGSVGIGTTTPSYKLDVQGGDINASGSVHAAGVALTSDIRYKRDIEPLDNALEKILNIRGVSYNWRTEEFPQKHFNDRHQVGVIAQEVETQFPEVVDTNKDGYKSVNYPALVAPLIEAVKTLYNRLTGVEATQINQAREIASKADKSEMEALKAKNQKLEQENVVKTRELEEVKARLDKIEKMLNSK